MTLRFLRSLLDEASCPFRGGGHFAYHYARGKLSSDGIFREILKRGLFTAQGRYLDLGCGQGSLFAWLLAARQLAEAGNWPKDWPAAPQPAQLHGIELMQRDVDRAAKAFAFFGPGRMKADIAAGQATLADVTGQTPRYFRATAGLRNPFLDPVLHQLGIRLASWTRRPYDTRCGDPDTVLARLTRNLAPGDILLLHDGHSARTADGQAVILAVLPRLLATLHEKQLNPVTLNQATT